MFKFMRYAKPLAILVPLIFILALIAAGAGLFYPGGDTPYPYTSLRGEEVTINARGLYYYDTVSSAAQMQANDLVALVLGLPLLAAAYWLALRGDPKSAWQLRGQFLLAGTLAFFLYTYMSMAMNTAFNPFFLLYVVLFGLSLYAFILSMMGFDVAALPARFSERLPRRAIAWTFIVTGAFLTLAWLGRIFTPILQGTPPALENTTTMVIQAMDLVLIMPLAFLAAALLLRRSAWGYLLGAVAAMKFITMGIAVSAMGINMTLQGVPDSAVLVGLFLVITVVNLVLAVLLLRSVLPVQAAKTSDKAARKRAFATKMQ